MAKRTRDEIYENRMAAENNYIEQIRNLQQQVQFVKNETLAECNVIADKELDRLTKEAENYKASLDILLTETLEKNNELEEQKKKDLKSASSSSLIIKFKLKRTNESSNIIHSPSLSKTLLSPTLNQETSPFGINNGK